MDDKYIQDHKAKLIRYATVNPLTLVTHIWDNYGEVNIVNIKANEDRMKVQWNPPLPHWITISTTGRRKRVHFVGARRHLKILFHASWLCQRIVYWKIHQVMWQMAQVRSHQANLERRLYCTYGVRQREKRQHDCWRRRIHWIKLKNLFKQESRMKWPCGAN